MKLVANNYIFICLYVYKIHVYASVIECFKQLISEKTIFWTF